MHRTLNVESGIEKMFDMMSEMTWLRIEGDAVVVESETYIRDHVDVPVIVPLVFGIVHRVLNVFGNLSQFELIKHHDYFQNQ